MLCKCFNYLFQNKQNNFYVILFLSTEVFRPLSFHTESGTCYTIIFKDFIKKSNYCNSANIQDIKCPFIQTIKMFAKYWLVIQGLIGTTPWHWYINLYFFYQAYSALGSADRPWRLTGSITSGAPKTGHEVLSHPDIVKIGDDIDTDTESVTKQWGH